MALSTEVEVKETRWSILTAQANTNQILHRRQARSVAKHENPDPLFLPSSLTVVALVLHDDIENQEATAADGAGIVLQKQQCQCQDAADIHLQGSNLC